MEASNFESPTDVNLPGAREARSPSPPPKKGSLSRKGRSALPPPKKASPPRSRSHVYKTTCRGLSKWVCWICLKKQLWRRKAVRHWCYGSVWSTFFSTLQVDHL